MTQANLEIEKRQVRLDVRDNGVAVITFESLTKENWLSNSVMQELEWLHDELLKNKSVKALAVLSSKDGFISGADLHEILKLETEAEGFRLSFEGRGLLEKFANLPFPTVVGINGSCLGGGLEFALHMTRRIASDSSTTIIGLPEVKLGLIPGLGGTQKLPQLIDVKTATEFILFSEMVDAKKALDMGIVDEVVPTEQLAARVEAVCLELAASDSWNIRKKNFETTPIEKQEKYFKMMERTLRIKTKGKYPAPVKALESIKVGLTDGPAAGKEYEARSFGELAASTTARNLIFIFFTTEFAKLSASSKASKLSGNPIRSVGIIGGGVMGTAIASWAAVKGFKVVVKAANPERTQLMLETVTADVNRIDGQYAESITAASTYEDLSEVDLLIEACSENIGIKIDLLSQILPLLKPDAIVATNTSSLSVNELVEKLNSTHDFFGVHFFHPVDRMPLVEVIPAANVQRESQAKILSFLSVLEKTPLIVKDSTCFVVNRLLCTYINEAARLAEADVPLNWIDDSPVEFGMPIGPWSVVDEVGMDVALLVADSLEEKIGERFTKPDVLKGVKALGISGKRSGKGIYQRDESGKVLGLNSELLDVLKLKVSTEKATPEESEQLTERMLYPMIDEAARCLSEKVVRRPRDIDMATVLGMGFPPFRGGLLKYADSVGIPTIIEKLEVFYKEPGPAREVSEYLKQMASSGRSFYSSGKDSTDA